MVEPLRIATISNNPDPDWAWLRDLMGADYRVGGRPLEWTSFSMSGARPAALARWRGAKAFARAANERPFDLVVTHGPWTTAWTEWVAGEAKAGTKHLAFSFNFTDLPAGPRKMLMTRAFRNVDAFAVFTDAEQGLYADIFGIDRSKLLRAPWGVAPPITTAPPHHYQQPYFGALGGEARDYAVLCEAARQCPDLNFIAITRPHNFDGLNPPDNLKVRFDMPFEWAWGMIWHSLAAIIPLRSRETPCGLVTLVGGMHLGKAQIVTDAAGAADYIKDGETGLLVPPGDAGALAAAIRRLAADPALAARLGAAAKTYAAAHCSEADTVRFFDGVLRGWFDAK
ncbi:MAG: glycosyltransferase [Parvularculaceae bacterium]